MPLRPRKLLCLLPLLLGFCAASTQAVENGETAPAFTLPPLRSDDGNADISLADFRGKVVYVDFWASWCPPCLVSIPLLNELRNRLVEAGEPFEVLAINVDSDPELGIEFLLDEPVQYLALRDPAGTTPALYQVPGMPTSYLVDARGQVRLVHTGFKRSDIDKIELEVTKLLDEIE
ncbi:MAG TPA: TlpA disulfide reductase family protein [Pseudomonadales bacterium]